MDPIVRQVLDALECREVREVKNLLHPYLHWTDEAGYQRRGRTTIMKWLEGRPIRSPPASYQLRDGQIYRWVAASREGR